MGLAGEVFLIKDGHAQAEIIVARQPARMAKLAAGELQTYLFKNGGAKLPITAEPGREGAFKIYVGRSAQTEARGLGVDGLRDGAYRMASGAGWMALLGPDRDFTPREPWARAKTPAESARVLKEWDAITLAPASSLPREPSERCHVCGPLRPPGMVATCTPTRSNRGAPGTGDVAPRVYPKGAPEGGAGACGDQFRLE